MVMSREKIIRRLPKAEEHIHLLGWLRPETLLWLIRKGEFDTPFDSLDDVREFFLYRDFPHFLEVYSTCMEYVANEDQFERITYEMLEDESRCNVQYVEVIFAAPNPVRRGLDYGSMIDAVNRGIRRGQREFGVECKIRIDLIRDYGPEHGMKILDLIEGKRDNTVGIDIGGSEQLYPPKPYTLVYQRAKQMGLHLTAHAGEAAGPESIWEAVKFLDVERVGHGLAAAKNPKLIDYLKEKKVTIEACPVSNVRTGAVPTIYEHPVKEFYNKGVNVTVNSDDPSLFNTNMNNEYIQLYRKLGFTIPDLFQLSLNSVDSAFLPEEKRKKLQESFTKQYHILTDNLDLND